MNFEINLIFLIRPCLYDQKDKIKIKYLVNEKSFYNEIKSTFHQF